ncbi:ABC transporter permease [Phycicoccus sp. BSK3Z-2]|uniref:ABC transporter permease n=1 Tax=Phycicoccus avicenniae TaxID=2828860 RepID=A0A941DAH7_9MICO|nr:ABC transporter permease [Phycicoccus avicenniae]MBR7744715.1 ABC transporter permease [Phycicoccus avicenniae]
MSTLTSPRPDLAPGPGTDDEPADASRFARWRSSWAVAMRMARRDVRRYRGRSALVVVMVLLPTLLLSAVVTLAYTEDVSGVEQIPSLMGSGQAVLEGPEPFPLAQGPTPSEGLAGGDDAATPVPGYDAEAGADVNAAAVADLLGRPVVAESGESVRVTLDGRRRSFSTLALDGRAGLGEKLTLTTGRWPEAPASDGPVEALVTPEGERRGLPTSGTFVGSFEGTERTVEVVGTADAATRWDRPGLVTAAPVGERAAGGRWIVTGSMPVLWEDVRALNEYGFQVTSAAVLADPPGEAELAPEVRDQIVANGNRTAMYVGLAGAMLLVTTTLLVGPAFAVNASRQRRTLALTASNGAPTAALRRTVLAQALVLGALSAVVAVGLGVAAAYGIVVFARARSPFSFTGPFDVRPLMLGGVLLCAVASTVVAALVPARRLGRLDIVGVMRGQSVSPRPSLLVLAVGVVTTTVGGLLTLAGTNALPPALASVVQPWVGYSTEYLVVVGAVVLVVGSLLLVPMVLAGVGRLGGRLPTSLRMATRDLARHRARSAPSVAAILAAVAGLTFGLTGLASDTEQAARQYLPSTVPGEVLVDSWGDDTLTTETVASAAGPDVLVTPNETFAGDPGRFSFEPPQDSYRVAFVSVVPEGCTVEETLGWISAGPDTEGCVVAGSESFGSGAVPVLPADELVRRLELSGADAEAVRAGAVVLVGDLSEPVRVAQGTYAVDPAATEPIDPDVETTSDEEVPAVVLPLTKDTSGRALQATMLVPAESSVSSDWPLRTGSWTVRTPDGDPVPESTVETLQERLGDEVGVRQENGFERSDRVVVAILLGVFALLILVVTLTSTALTLAEQQTDQATLAALGATRGTRRVMAAAQAFALAVVGCVLGVAIGIVPGIAISVPLTSGGYDPLAPGGVGTEGSILVVPWVSLLVVGVLVPVVAAALAAAGIRKAPQVTRRTT